MWWIQDSNSFPNCLAFELHAVQTNQLVFKHPAQRIDHMIKSIEELRGTEESTDSCLPFHVYFSTYTCCVKW